MKDQRLAPRPENWEAETKATMLSNGVEPDAADRIIADILHQREQLEARERLYGPPRKKFTAAGVRQKGKRHDSE